MSRNLKHYCELRLGSRKVVRFTAVDIEHLVARFQKELTQYQNELNETRTYIWIEPTLITEVCESWAQFDQYEH